MTGSGTACAARRRELGACLRAYRRLTAPSAVGLVASGRRRTPGLRREEVATLAGVGLSWYTWLEQGRVTASGQVLESVGRVLGVDDAGRRHLRQLSAPDPQPVAPPGAARGLVPVLAAYAGPAVLLDHRLDVLAANAAWTRAWGDPHDLDPARRHLLRQLAAAPPADGRDELVTALARLFRMAANLHAGDPRIADVASLLRAEVPAYAALWDCRSIGAFGEPSVVADGRRLRAHLLEPGALPGTSLLLLAGGD